ncbi:hypothetical protein FRC05_004028 [Tulasnella sp. 425]|nr:hypothetical protein FRC05_004028 [Tulasnella sp. 425]
MSSPSSTPIGSSAVPAKFSPMDDDIEYDDTPYDNTNIQPSTAHDNHDDLSDHEIGEKDHRMSEAEPPTPPPPPPPPSLLVKGPIRRSYFKFPSIGEVDYDYYARRPQGYCVPELGWKWSLYKNDWFYIDVQNVVVLVGRSILLEMGITNEELPPPGDQDLEEARGLPERPIRLQDWHQMKDHSAGVCYWPEMTEDPKSIPVLDRSLGEHLLDSLVVHDPQNVTHLHRPSHFPQSDSDPDKASGGGGDSLSVDDTMHSFRAQSASTSSSLLKADFREEDYTIKYIRVDPAIIGIPEQAGIGHSAAAWDAKLDLPYALVNALLHRCYRDSSEAHNDWDRECPNPYQPTEADLTGNPDEPSHRRDGLPTRFRVIAKVAAMERESHNFINNEAKAYWRMPKTFSEQWSGYQLVPQVHLPQPAAAIVPIMFGYYVPDVCYGKLSNGQRVYISDQRRLSPLLLMENCGMQFDVEMNQLHIEYKEQLYTMMKRLHLNGFTQGSVYPRNWLVQPGPLSVAPSRRSLERPNFRMIDFGRAVCKKDVSQEDFIKQGDDDIGKLQELLDYVHWKHYPE